jgi:hypothetical protein
VQKPSASQLLPLAIEQAENKRARSASPIAITPQLLCSQCAQTKGKPQGQHAHLFLRNVSKFLRIFSNFSENFLKLSQKFIKLSQYFSDL